MCGFSCSTVATMPHLQDALADGGYGEDVIHGFARQPDHEVELDGTPATIERQLGALSYLLVADSLVDGVAQPLRPRLRRKKTRCFIASG